MSATAQVKELWERLKQLDQDNKRCLELKDDALTQSSHWKDKYLHAKKELENTQGGYIDQMGRKSYCVFIN